MGEGRGYVGRALPGPRLLSRGDILGERLLERDLFCLVETEVSTEKVGLTVFIGVDWKSHSNAPPPELGRLK